MLKFELRKIIKEEINNTLNESGYIELISNDPDFVKGYNLMKKAYDKWKNGPLTASSDITPARKEMITWLFGKIKTW